MDWTSFGGALAGAVVGVLVIVGLAIGWDYIDQRRAQSKQTQEQPPSSVKSVKSIKDILESQLEQYIVENFDSLFPGWKIFDEPARSTSQPQEDHKPLGVRYRTEAGEIDILAIDPRGTLIVIELKRDRASDKVSAQLDRYVAWVKKHLAKPDQKVRGLIIARSIESRLAYTLLRRRGISVWTYEWHLKFDKRPAWKRVTATSSRQVTGEMAEGE